jgi:D-arabinose 5-phosphate isomerase GutQ
MEDLEILSLARETIRREALAVAALADHLDEGLLHVIELMRACQGHVLVTGAGTSHAMAERLAHLLSCCGTPALCISAADSLHGTSGAITARDVVYIISKGGRSAEVNRFAEIARSRGARLIAQTEDPASPLAQMCDAVWVVPTPPEVDPYGMIALGSSLVAGAAGDALCRVLLELSHYSLDQFAATHPGGAVGHKLAQHESPTSTSAEESKP